MSTGQKTCFVIAPIGPDGSATRLRSDQLFRYLISPAAAECGYAFVHRADDLGRPGLITTQIMEHLLRSELVIADLSDHNPNVFYELAVRHFVARPVVQLIVHDQPIPFDLAQLRTIKYDLGDLDAVTASRQQLITQIQHAERRPSEADNPIGAFTSRSMRNLSKGFLLLVGPPELWPDFEVTRIEWLPEECFVLYGENWREPVRVAPSGIGPTFQVILPDGIFDRLTATDTLELQLKDTKGNRWRVKPFFPFRKLLSVTALEPKDKIISDYGDGA